MRVNVYPKKGIRVLAGLAPVLLSLFFVSGCNLDGYSEDMTYPGRTDPIVTALPKEDTFLEPPGRFAFQTAAFVDGKGETFDPMKLNPEQHAQFDKTLRDLFGTPAHPQVKGISDEAREKLELQDAKLAEGSMLYHRHCLHCHGLTGDGHGPTAPWVNPHPRDYRVGKFKFSSVLGGNERKPRRDDLVRTLRQGIEGTSMPTFGLLADNDLNALASYVIHLSMRGEAESSTMRELAASSPPPVSDTIKDYLSTIADNWMAADAKKIEPGPYPFAEEQAYRQSVANGKKLFTNLCLGCHTDYGRRNTYKWDDWGTVVRPADLTHAVYRGGRRPIDLFWRVSGGINGTPMPKIDQGAKSKEEWEKEIWDIVNFVQTLPYPGMLKEYEVGIE